MHKYNNKQGTGQVALTVGPGATVNVVNRDAQAHTVTSKSTGAFDAQVTANGSTSFKAPTIQGNYNFVCSIHADMAATLVVKA